MCANRECNKSVFVGEKLVSIVYNEYFTGGISVLKLPITLFVNREDVYKLAVKLFVYREDEEGAPSESGRTGAIGKNSNDNVCLDGSKDDSSKYSHETTV